MKFSPTITVTYGALGWSSALLAAFQANRRAAVRINGQMAFELQLTMQRLMSITTPAAPASVPIPYPSIAISSLLVNYPDLLSHVYSALTVKGYNTLKVSFNSNGSGVANDVFLLKLR